jgi:hypothetical protein
VTSCKISGTDLAKKVTGTQNRANNKINIFFKLILPESGPFIWGIFNKSLALFLIPFLK